MAHDAVPIEVAHASIRKLIAEKLRYLVPMTIIFMVGYIGLTVLAGAAKGFLGLKVVGALNLGYVLIMFNYLLSWTLAILYVRVANDVFDPLARNVADTLSRAGGST